MALLVNKENDVSLIGMLFLTEFYENRPVYIEAMLLTDPYIGHDTHRRKFERSIELKM
jgi:hypothetical protein